MALNVEFIEQYPPLLVTELEYNTIYRAIGPGFKDDISDIVTPFFTRKPDGIGIGMYLIDTIMMKYGKVDIITDKEKLIEIGVPIKYNGAAVILKFIKKQE